MAPVMLPVLMALACLYKACDCLQFCLENPEARTFRWFLAIWIALLAVSVTIAIRACLIIEQ